MIGFLPKSSLALLGAVALLLGGTSAQAAQTQTAQSAPDYQMPAGDFRSAADSAALAGQAIPRRSPTPAAELARIKSLDGGTAESSVVVDVDSDSVAGPEPRGFLISCAMQGNTGFAPSDVHGAAGPTNIIEVTNVDINVQNKTTCAVVSALSLKTFFSQGRGFTIPGSETLFDPRVLYDRLSNRCIVTVESRNSGNTDQFLYIASSRTSDCTTWRRHRFVLSQGTSIRFCKASRTDFYDYPNAGYNSRRLVVTSNNFKASGSAYGTVMSIDKIALHGTAGVDAKCFRSGVPTNSAPAVVGDFSTAMFLLSPGFGTGSSLARRRLDTAGAVGSDSLTGTFPIGGITIPLWFAPPNAAQPNGQKLDTLDGRFQSASKQIGNRIWNVHSVNIGGFARTRLYKLSTTGGLLFFRTPTTSSCHNKDHLFNPSVDTNSTLAGTIAFVTKTRTCPSQPTAGRAAMLITRGANHSNTGWVFHTIATSTTQFTGCASGGCRWGDYSSTQIDPTNIFTAWGFNQLVTGTTQFNWGTRAGRVN